MNEIVARLRLTIDPHDHPYLTGAWTPCDTEWNAPDLKVIGEVPKDLDGVYLRNGQNPVHEPIGRYHLFDGDGMIHALSFKDGKAEYRNRWVRTKAFNEEQKAGRSLWAGLIEPESRSERPGWGPRGLKDNSATDVVLHAGRALTMFYQCGEVYRLHPRTLEQYGADNFGGRFPAEGVSAHSHVDEVTGDFLFFNYGMTAPYMHYGVVNKQNELVHYVPIDLPGPRLPHDMSFSENWTILHDLPLFWDPELLAKGVHRVRHFRDMPARFGLIPRFGSNADIRWFEASSAYIYHTINAFEEGDEVVMDACICLKPEPESPPAAKGYARMMAYLDLTRMDTRLHRWRFNLKTGACKEERLDDRVTEFPMANFSRAGRKHRYSYNMVPKPGMLVMDGIVKYDIDGGKAEEFMFGPGRYGSESPFAPRVNAKDEDDGYVVMPNVFLPVEMVNLMTASRAYEANLNVLQSFQQMANQSLALIRS